MIFVIHSKGLLINVINHSAMQGKLIKVVFFFFLSRKYEQNETNGIVYKNQVHENNSTNKKHEH